MAWPVVGSRRPDDRRFGHGGVANQGVLDLGRRDAVARDVHHVVDPTEQPHVAVVVPLCPVAGEYMPGKRDQ